MTGQVNFYNALDLIMLQKGATNKVFSNFSKQSEVRTVITEHYNEIQPFLVNNNLDVNYIAYLNHILNEYDGSIDSFKDKLIPEYLIESEFTVITRDDIQELVDAGIKDISVYEFDLENDDKIKNSEEYLKHTAGRIADKVSRDNIVDNLELNEEVKNETKAILFDSFFNRIDHRQMDMSAVRYDLELKVKDIVEKNKFDEATIGKLIDAENKMFNKINEAILSENCSFLKAQYEFHKEYAKFNATMTKEVALKQLKTKGIGVVQTFEDNKTPALKYIERFTSKLSELKNFIPEKVAEFNNRTGNKYNIATYVKNWINDVQLKYEIAKEQKNNKQNVSIQDTQGKVVDDSTFNNKTFEKVPLTFNKTEQNVEESKMLSDFKETASATSYELKGVRAKLHKVFDKQGGYIASKETDKNLNETIQNMDAVQCVSNLKDFGAIWDKSNIMQGINAKEHRRFERTVMAFCSDENLEHLRQSFNNINEKLDAIVDNRILNEDKLKECNDVIDTLCNYINTDKEINDFLKEANRVDNAFARTYVEEILKRTVETVIDSERVVEYDYGDKKPYEYIVEKYPYAESLLKHNIESARNLIDVDFKLVKNLDEKDEKDNIVITATMDNYSKLTVVYDTDLNLNRVLYQRDDNAKIDEVFNRNFGNYIDFSLLANGRSKEIIKNYGNLEKEIRQQDKGGYVSDRILQEKRNVEQNVSKY